NQNYLNRLYKKEQGIGIKEYMVNIKIDYAKTLLATTNLSVNEVADQAFFSDAKHFMRTFKQKNGLTPSDYRAENAQTNLNSSQMNLSAPLPQQLGNEALK
ncbi:helix-turn-helix transcriptional regulator, partial [Enterococcus faecalis]|nr:helix-turn-helix transcriptional regulator [Enterococcus faecalis]